MKVYWTIKREWEAASGEFLELKILAQPPAAKEPDLRWIDGPYCEGWEDVGRGQWGLIPGPTDPLRIGGRSRV